MNWYYVQSGQQAGPVEDAQLEELFRTGHVQADTLVWSEGMANWQPLREAKPVAANVSVEPPMIGGAAPAPAVATNEGVCAECGRIFPIENMIQYGASRVCAGCKPIFLQKLSEGAKIQTPTLAYAGFWVRAAAKLLDGLILGVFLIVPIIFLVAKSAGDRSPERFQIFQLVIQFGYMLLNMGYQIFFLGKYGATPGKMVCKLQVVMSDGEKLSYGRATGRFFAEMLSGITCYIGYIIAAFDDQKRALHDHICNTRVVMK